MTGKETVLFLGGASSCASLDKNVLNGRGMPLSEENLGLLSGTYERKPLSDTQPIDRYTNSNLLSCFFLKPSRYGFTDSLQQDFVTLEVIDRRTIAVCLLEKGRAKKTRTLHGKIVDNTFEINRRFFLIPLLFLNFAETRKTRIEMLQNGNVLLDTVYEAIANFLILPWGLSYYESDLEFRKIK